MTKNHIFIFNWKSLIISEHFYFGLQIPYDSLMVLVLQVIGFCLLQSMETVYGKQNVYIHKISI